MKSLLMCLVGVMVGFGCGGGQDKGSEPKTLQPAKYVLKSACRGYGGDPLWVKMVFGAAPDTESASDVILTLSTDGQQLHAIENQEDIHVMTRTQSTANQIAVDVDTWHEPQAQPINPDGHFETTVNALDCQ